MKKMTYFKLDIKGSSLKSYISSVRLCKALTMTVFFSYLRAADAVITGHVDNIITYHMNNISNGKGGKPQLPLVRKDITELCLL